MTTLRPHRLSPQKPMLLAVAACVALLSGCIPSRTINRGLFASDPAQPPVVRVRLTEADSVISLHAEGRFVLSVYDAGACDAVTYSSGDSLTVSFSRGGIDVTTPAGLMLADGASGISVHTIEAQHRFRVNGSPYYGTLMFGMNSKQEPLIVNRLNLDTYLRGVLTPELGERKPEEFEAVKAQAVASRTYALSCLGQYDGESYDLIADVGDQVYVGASQPRDWVDRAVAETAGEVLTHDGQLVDAYYHSTCGGRTDAAEDIWETSPRAYLTSAQDDTFCVWSSYSEWQEDFDRETLLGNLNAYREKMSSPPFGEITAISDIRLEQETPGGRIRTMVVVTPHGKWSIRADQIRWALGRPSRPETILPSSRFTMMLQRDGAGDIISMQTTGSGYGHGIGMCQCGMIGRARAGQEYRKILTTYYHGARVDKVY